MALLTPTELKEHVETDLGNPALQRVLDSEDSEIVRRFGAHVTESEMLEGGEPYLIRVRAATSITSIVETVGDTDTTLETDDYRLWSGGLMLQRLDDGTNPLTDWGERVVVSYVPEDVSAQRTLVLIQLCKLAIEYKAISGHTVGARDYAEKSLDYTQEREKLLRSLKPRKMVFA